ncbi:MAG: RNA 2',3'-cyclic phosphodiesterase [Halarsenatibacteraceae bacterium]
MRLFVAAPLSEKTRKEISLWQQDIADKTSGRIKFVKPENLHITLKFLGDTEDEKRDEIISGLDSLKVRSSFKADIQTVSAFPGIKNPKVLVAKLINNKELIQEIFSELENELSEIGFKKEDRYFIPHITLARTKDNQGRDSLADWFESRAKTQFNKILFEVDRICLFQSILKSDGPIYKEIFCKFYK